MAYNKADLEKKALAAIKKHNLVFIDEVVSYLPCSAATFYNHKLEKLETIKEALNTNKVDTKNNLRKKWLRSDNATLQIALYKLLSTEQELKALNGQSIDHTTGGEKIKIPNFKWGKEE